METQDQAIVEEPVGKPSNYLTSRYNAVRHKMTAKTVVLSGESQEDFDFMSKEIKDRVNPRGRVEEELVDQITYAFWKIKRCRDADRVFIDKHTTLVNSGKRDINWAGVFTSEFMGKLNRYETTALNQVKKLFDMLAAYRNMQAAEVIDADVSDK
jgi:hypothetical protein